MNQFTHPVGRRSATLTGYVQQTSSALPNLNVCPAVLICPGGGYAYCTDREAEPVALAFLNAGYNAFVLRYTVSTSCPGAEVFDNALAEAEESDPVGDERGAVGGQHADPHVDHRGLVGPRQGLPVERRLAGAAVASGEHHRLGVVAVGQRDAGVGAGPAGGGDAGHHLEGHAGLEQLLELLAATPEDERVAALQAHHLAALPGQAHQQPVDLFLGQGVVAGLLADVDHLGAAAGKLQHAIAHQVIDHQRVGLPDQAGGAQGEQLRVAGAGADQGDPAHRAGIERAGGVGSFGPPAADPLVEE